MLRSVIKKLNFGQKSKYNFSGAHHVKLYDWRDDHALNPFFQQDPRHVGTPNPFQYSFPYEGENKYNPKDLTMNYVIKNSHIDPAAINLLQCQQQNLWDDVSHEWDYESQDLDFQPETFKYQHFRKKGLMWIWVLVALTPYALVIAEVVYNQMVDGDGLKYQRPPPLNYPDDEDTPDFQTYETFKSPQFTYAHDAGLLKDPFFEIVDGKKIYSKWAGVNQPGVVIK